MPRSPKPRTSPEASLDNPDVRRRVVKACQRCRLKKCKCDGATPCTRCKSDDAICAYGKHKKSDKTVFRSGYVQMLERQHAQLIAGLQELYRRTQKGDGWTEPPLELGCQPLTHKILEALGVLQPDPWQDTEDVGNTWQVFEKQGHDDNGWIYSNTGSPSTQAAFSPASPAQSAFPQSTIMSKRRSKCPSSLAPTAPTLPMPPPLMANLAPIKPEAYNYPLPTPMSTLSDNFLPNEAGLDRGLGLMDWSLGMDDLFGNLGGQEQSVKGC